MCEVARVGGGGGTSNHVESRRSRRIYSSKLALELEIVSCSDLIRAKTPPSMMALPKAVCLTDTLAWVLRCQRPVLLANYTERQFELQRRGTAAFRFASIQFVARSTQAPVKELLCAGATVIRVLCFCVCKSLLNYHEGSAQNRRALAAPRLFCSFDHSSSLLPPERAASRLAALAAPCLSVVVLGWWQHDWLSAAAAATLCLHAMCSASLSRRAARSLATRTGRPELGAALLRLAAWSGATLQLLATAAALGRASGGLALAVAVHCWPTAAARGGRRYTSCATPPRPSRSSGTTRRSTAAELRKLATTTPESTATPRFDPCSGAAVDACGQWLERK